MKRTIEKNKVVLGRFGDGRATYLNVEELKDDNKHLSNHGAVNIKTYEVELTITQRFNTRVKVSGDFKDKNDPEIEKAAKIEADRMDHNHWGYDDTEFEVDNVFEIKL